MAARALQALRLRPWVAAFAGVAALRFLSAVPFIIDDDEGWWVAASRALRSPWEYYFRAVDHKTPGVVWFYWFLDHALGTQSDPRLTRALYCLFLAAAAGLVGWMAGIFARDRAGRASAKTGWIAATFFLVGSLAACPKLFSVTADGVMTLFIAAGYALAFGFEFPGRSLLAGALLGCGVMVKQTGVFFALPVLFCRVPRKFSWSEIAGFAIGSLLVIVPMIWAMDPATFFYWNWTYPREVLLAVRSRLFDGQLQLALSLIWIAFALWPLLSWACFPRTRRGRAFWWHDARALWLLSGVVVMLMGQGLFLHYFISLMPPLALLAAEGLSERTPQESRLGLRWLAGGYLACGAIIVYTPLATVWGTDLPYFERVGKVLRETIPPGEKIMIWGGSALPLAYSGLDYVTAYVTPRFGVQPYGSPRSHADFVETLLASPPAAVVDLSERGDNQFNNPLESEPAVAGLVKASYRPYVLPGLPWAKFYLRFAPPASSRLEALGAPDHPFPSERRAWQKIWQGSFLRTLAEFPRTERKLRALQGLELIALQSQAPQIRLQAQRLSAELAAEPAQPPSADIERFLSRLDPLPWQSIHWWTELFFVEEQPRAVSGPPASAGVSSQVAAISAGRSRVNR